MTLNFIRNRKRSEFETLSESQRLKIQEDAPLLYGLLHRRFIVTKEGLKRMRDKYTAKDFGVCHRAQCQQTKLLPIGITEEISDQNVRLFCAHCEELYIPSNLIHQNIDGAFFGTTFAHLFLMEFPMFRPRRVSSMNKKYIPKIYGYPLHSSWHEVALQSFEHRLMNNRPSRRSKEMEESNGVKRPNIESDPAQNVDELEYLRKWKRLQIQETQRMKELLRTKEQRIAELQRVWFSADIHPFDDYDHLRF